MIGLDTNVLIRFITRDSEDEWSRVFDLMSRHDGFANSIHITDAVLCEVAWVLKSNYKYTKDRLIEGLEMLSNTNELEFSSRTIFKQAIELYKNGKADFTDYFIILKNKHAGCEYTYSFDKKLLNESLAVPIPN